MKWTTCLQNVAQDHGAAAAAAATLQCHNDPTLDHK
jgi:hypothetical protein